MSGYFLDGPLYYLGRDLPEVVDVLMVEGPQGRAAPLFRSEAGAERYLAGAPESVGVRRVEAADLRAKEELLRAALAAGAALLWLEPDPQTHEPAEVHLTQRALNYILSFKNEAACV